MAWPGINVTCPPLLNQLPSIHDVDQIGIACHYSKVVRNQDHGNTQATGEVFHQLQNLGLNGDVQGCGRLIRQDQRRVAGQGHGDHESLPHTAAEVVGIPGELVRSVGNANQGQQLHGPLAGRLGRQVKMNFQGLCELATDGQDRIEGRHGLLEDHGNVPPAYTPHSLFIQRQQVALPKADLTANNAPGWSGNQPHNAEGTDRLPTPRLANQRHGFAGAHVIAHPIDGADGPCCGEEIGFEVSDRQQHIPHPLYGCAASQLRKPCGRKGPLHLRPCVGVSSVLMTLAA